MPPPIPVIAVSVEVTSASKGNSQSFKFQIPRCVPGRDPEYEGNRGR
jgi:hypothetical protein